MLQLKVTRLLKSFSFYEKFFQLLVKKRYFWRQRGPNLTHRATYNADFWDEIKYKPVEHFKRSDVQTDTLYSLFLYVSRKRKEWNAESCTVFDRAWNSPIMDRETSGHSVMDGLLQPNFLQNSQLWLYRTLGNCLAEVPSPWCLTRGKVCLQRRLTFERNLQV